MESLQMNSALCDLVDGLLGTAVLIAARIIAIEDMEAGVEMGRRSVAFFVVSNTIDDLTTIFTSTFKTLMVSIYVHIEKVSKPGRLI